MSLSSVPAFVWPVIVILHGVSHGGVLCALAWIAARPGTETGGWSAARSWLLPGLPAGTATGLAVAAWGIALVGFVVAGLGISGILPLGDAWRPIALVTATVSLAGILVFAGTWPAFNTIAAIAVNVGIIVAAAGLVGAGAS